MTQSDEQGFHQSSIELFTIKTRHFYEGKQTKIRNKGVYLYRSPLSLHYQLQLYEYPKHLDHFLTPKSIQPTRNSMKQHCKLIQNEVEMPILLSQFFPRRLNCVYNRFGENLMLKRDTTILIRNIASRIRNDQVITFHDRTDPKHPNSPITFTSNFEGGNLHCAYRERGSTCYYLLLQNDINTHGYNIWFHFNVKAQQPGTFQFVVANLAKEVKFSEEIMLLSYSSKSTQYTREITFDCRETKFRHCESLKRFWSINFSYTFEAGQDIYVSLCPPYTFSKLLRLIKQITQPFYEKISITAEIAGKTELGNYIPCLRIAAKEKSSKSCILITARQHPCETMSSFVCQQLIKGITENTQLAHDLCEVYTFFIFPMVNPDGVIHGNSRTNLMGYDINRSWDLGLATETAQAVHIWAYILRIIEQGYEITWSFDLHGHSKELGYFAYFCEENQDTIVFNHNLAAHPLYYQAERCGFTINKSKRQSIRGQLYSKLQLRNAVTVETSYYGYRNQNGVLVQWSQHHYQQIASHILSSLLQTDKILKNKAHKHELLQSISKIARQAQKKLQSFYQSHQIDSDSDPEQDYLRKQERSQVKGDIFLKENIKFRTKTQSRGRSASQEDPPRYRNFGGSKQARFGSASMNKSSTIQKDKQKNLTFYAGRRTLSPKSNNNPMSKGKFRRRINVQPRFKTQIPSNIDDQEDQQYIKKTYELKKTHLEQQNKKLKTFVGGFRTCYEVLGLKTIVYPTAASSGLEFQNSLKSKKDIIKEIRTKEFSKGNQRRKLSETFWNELKKPY